MKVAFLVLVGAGVLALPATAVAKKAKVIRVIDGDSAKLKAAQKKGTYHLKGVDAPELSGNAAETCFGKEAKDRLKKLMPKGKKVGVNGSKQAKITRSGKSINLLMVATGHARAKPGGGKFGNRLRGAEKKAKAADRGLWKACAASPGDPGDFGDPGDLGGPGDPGDPNGDVTGQQAIDQMTQELNGMAFEAFRTSSSPSESFKFQFHMCEDKRFRYREEHTITDPALSSFTISEYYGQPWTVVEALIKGDGSYRGAKVEGVASRKKVASGGGTSEEPANHPASFAFEWQSGQWYWNQRVAGTYPNQADCNDGI